MITISVTYNAAGERIVKSHGTMEGVYINGAPQGITSDCVDFRRRLGKSSELVCSRLALKFHETDEFTLYPASIMSVNKTRFTKHYFIGSQRIASKIGTGTFNNVYGINGSRVTAGQQDYAARMQQIESQKEEYYRKLGIAPGVPTMKGSYGDPENTGVGYNSVITELGDHSVPEGWVQTLKHNDEQGSNPGAPISWNAPTNPEDATAGYGYIADDTTDVEDIYYFHSDHLGSMSYVTDRKGNITQYDAYLPYGELLVDEHSSSEDMPYKFNGKEMDEETGLYYYGARYMNPVTSLWYGVDPLAEKYVATGGYVYTLDNPVKLVDPDGQHWVEHTIDGVNEYYYDRNIKSQKDISRLYGPNSGIKYIANKTSVVLGKNKYTFYNDYKQNKYGTVFMNGKKQSNSNIIYGKSFTIFGTSDNSVNAKTLHRNYMGTSYTGPNNPQSYTNKDSYQYVPRNRSEIGSYVHDCLYDKAGAAGINGALFDSDQRVINADEFLILYNELNMMAPGTSLKDRGRSAATVAGFVPIVLFKESVKYIKKEIQVAKVMPILILAPFVNKSMK